VSTFSGEVLVEGWVGQAGSGGLFAVVSICSHAFCQGHAVGRCITSRRAERASRAGTVMSWARMVPVVARAWKLEARAPAVRVRLKAMAAQTSQALLAQKCPAGAPADRSSGRRGLFDDGVGAVRFLGLEHRQRAVGEHRGAP